MAAAARSTGVPRVVLATRPTEYEHLLARHATAGQAQFFLAQRGQDLQGLQQRHARQQEALRRVESAIPRDWRRARVRRADFERFLFEPEDLVVAVGQDGLVANLAKHLDGQPVLGINPMPELYDGVLVPNPPDAIASLFAAAGAGDARIEERTMVQARLDDGQHLLALNEVFVGHVSHQSARYRIRITAPGQPAEERQSSSGLIVATGTGATGWARSIQRERAAAVALPAPTEPALVFFVREAFPSVATGTALTQGRVAASQCLEVVSEMETGGVVFGDGIESDRLELLWGQRATVEIAARHLRLQKLA